MYFIIILLLYCYYTNRQIIKTVLLKRNLQAVVVYKDTAGYTYVLFKKVMLSLKKPQIIGLNNRSRSPNQVYISSSVSLEPASSFSASRENLNHRAGR